MRRRALLTGGSRNILRRKLDTYYKFEASNRLYATVGVDIGVRMGTPVLESGKIDNCLRFNQNQCGFRAPTSDFPKMYDENGLLPFSISVWLKIESDIPTSNTAGIIYGLIGRTGTTRDQWFIRYRTFDDSFGSGFGFVKVDSSGTQTRIVLADLELPFDTWLNIIVTDPNLVGGGGEKIYVDSTEVPVTISDTGYDDFSSNTPYGVCVSALSAANYTNQYFPGSIDELAIFRDYVLEQKDIDWIYNEGMGREIL